MIASIPSPTFSKAFLKLTQVKKSFIRSRMQNINSIGNIVSQKTAKGFVSKLPYVGGSSIFPWVWDLETEAPFESELLWNLSIANVLGFDSDKSTQTDGQSLHQSYKETRKRELSDFKSAAELLQEEESKNDSRLRKIATKKSKFISPLLRSNEGKDDKENVDERLKNVDPNMVKMIKNEIMDKSHPVAWNDIAGLEHAKKSIKEIVVWPMLRPDLFNGIRGPPKGLLLFGPPGTGKTLIGKCIASQCKATFFSISSSSLTSKWVGEGEKMVRALFAVARVHQPSVIFVDEIDSLLTQRLEGEQEATRRIKTEFLVQFDGVGTDSEDRILLIGATNRPQEIDEAARRRFRKKLYIPLPEDQARQIIVENLLKKQQHSLSCTEIEMIIQKTKGYSGSDMDGLVREAAIGPLRDIVDIEAIEASQVRPISAIDFKNALLQVRASVSEKDLDLYREFDRSFGSLA